MDIRHPVGTEVTFEALAGNCELVPNLHFFNEEGTYAFVSSDQDDEWGGRPRPKGIFCSTAWIPGNLLSEGTLIVGVAVTTFVPLTVHFYERDAVAFQVIESIEVDSARRAYGGHIPGVVRPKLEWDTKILSTSRLGENLLERKS